VFDILLHRGTQKGSTAWSSPHFYWVDLVRPVRNDSKKDTYGHTVYNTRK